MTDADLGRSYFEVGAWHISRSWWRKYWKLLYLADTLNDYRISRQVASLRRSAASDTPCQILIAAVEVKGRESDLRRVLARLVDDTRHQVTVSVVPMAPVGKFDNINLALKGHALESFDWILIVDDDISLPDGALDIMIHVAGQAGFKLAQPAHRYRSYASFRVTERRWASLARRTAFVEIGPVTLLHRDTFSDLLPFPSLRWGWGLDFYWADLAQRRGWAVGVIDAVSISHLRPIGGTYSSEAALTEAADFLVARGVTIDRKLMLTTSREV